MGVFITALFMAFAAPDIAPEEARSFVRTQFAAAAERGRALARSVENTWFAPPVIFEDAERTDRSRPAAARRTASQRPAQPRAAEATTESEAADADALPVPLPPPGPLPLLPAQSIGPEGEGLSADVNDAPAPSIGTTGSPEGAPAIAASSTP